VPISRYPTHVALSRIKTCSSVGAINVVANYFVSVPIIFDVIAAMLPGVGVHLLSFTAIILNAIVTMVPKISEVKGAGVNRAVVNGGTD